MRLTNRTMYLILACSASLIIAACDADKSTALQDSIVATDGTVSDYDLGAEPPVLPYPNDLLFSSVSPDGTLNIPVVDPNDLADPAVALNSLDGFSTVAPMSTGFTQALDPASISGESVRVYPVTTAAGPGTPVSSVGTALTFGVDYIATLSSVDSTNTTLVILPLKPLHPKSAYSVVITSKLKSTAGRSVGISGSYLLTRGTSPIVKSPPSTPISPNDILVESLRPAEDATQADIDAAYTDAATLNAIRSGIVQPSELAIVTADTGITSSDIILHWTFTTQSTTDVLTQVRTDVIATAPTSAVVSTPVSGAPVVAADIHLGTLDVPYFLTAASGIHDPAPLAKFWKGAGDSLLTSLAPNPGCLPAGTNVCPVATSIQTIPMMLSVPKSTVTSKPVTGWPVVIYQHGITTNRTTMLAVADAFAQAGIAIVAIDMPLHGVTGDETDGTAAFRDTINGERTFDLDLLTQDAATGDITDFMPDGITDTSGIHYLNLANLQTARDNLRQSVSDLFALREALKTMDVDGGGADFDNDNVYFLGHSLGGIVGLTFLAHEPDVKDAVIAMSGGGIAKLLDGSARFGPTISALLATKTPPVTKGSADYESFFGAAQALVDSGDPINVAAAAATGRSILFFEVVGGGGVPSDDVIPNRVPDGNDTSGTVPGPLSGTDPLVGVDADIMNTGLGLTQYDGNSTIPTSPLALVRFIAGDHGSLLSPAASPEVTTEMQTEAASFIASAVQGAPTLVITDNSVIAAP